MNRWRSGDDRATKKKGRSCIGTTLVNPHGAQARFNGGGVNPMKKLTPRAATIKE
jgi:hypothetical protein